MHTHCRKGSLQLKGSVEGFPECNRTLTVQVFLALALKLSATPPLTGCVPSHGFPHLDGAHMPGSQALRNENDGEVHAPLLAACSGRCLSATPSCPVVDLGLLCLSFPLLPLATTAPVFRMQEGSHGRAGAKPPREKGPNTAQVTLGSQWRWKERLEASSLVDGGRKG